MKQHLIVASLLLFCIITFSCTKSHPKVSDIETNYFISNDISNQQITSFAEDNLGQIWIGTFRGLNKYNAREFHQYFNSNDSLSLPDNQVRSLLCDSKGRLWVATVNGVCRYNDQDYWERMGSNTDKLYALQILENHNEKIFIRMGREIGLYLPDENRFETVIHEFSHDSTYIENCFIDAINQLWVINPYAIHCYDSNTFELKQSIPSQGLYIQHSFLQENGYLWLSSYNHLMILDTETGQFIEKPEVIQKHPKLSDVVIENFHKYDSCSLLINTQEGFFLYNHKENKVTYQDEVGFPFAPPQCKVTTLFTDSQSNLWIGSFDKGFVTCYNYKERFNDDNYLRAHTERSSVISLVKDNDNQLWITTAQEGVMVYNLHKGTIHPIETHHFYPEKKHFPNQVKSIFIDQDNKVWLIGNNKLIRCNYNSQTHSLQLEDIFWLGMFKSELTQDNHGTIWAASHGQHIYALRKGANTFQELALFPPGFTFTNAITTLSTGEVMVSAFPHNPRLIDPETWEIKEVDVRPTITRSTFIPVCLHEDSQGDVWIGTISNGVIKYSPKEEKVECIEGTSCTDISSIQEDEYGNVWVGTLYGLSKYDRATQRFTNYYKSDGIGGNQFNERAACRLENGQIIFGATHGLTFFQPIENREKRNIPLLFTDLKIHNQLIRPFQSNCIDRNLAHNPEIRLEHDQNSFTISFAALDYSEFERVHYYYMIECFDKHWIDARNNHEAYYSNLPAGKYTFKVRITNNDKSIVEAENEISIIIKPAPWATWWAYSIYWIVALLIVIIIINQYNRNRTNQLRIAQAEFEKQQEQRVNQMNMSFFANVSHEFRTPLTMISGPMTQLCHAPEIVGEQKQLLYIVQRSVNRMLKLVNQLMDFNKLENDTLKLAVSRTEVINELNQIIELFRVNCSNKGVELKTYGLEDTFITWIDSDKLDKITSNLISNALKFTERGGRISIKFDVICPKEASTLFELTTEEKTTEYIKITVEDNGCGIPQDKLERIFERYYQINAHSKGTYNWGTGIGLYYAQCLVKLHHGHIKALNGAEGGAVFIFLLPTADNAYSIQERLSLKDAQEVIYPIQVEKSSTPMQEVELVMEKAQRVLLVDDDPEVVYYLKTLLSPHYKVTCCFDGESAYKALEEEPTDIILSDVVMPSISGYQLCQQIKENIQLSHIPVILVTAKATIENQIEGLDTGADAYVTKPFDPTYLLALINSQLKNREKIRNLLATTTKTGEIAQNILSPQDNTFMTELYQLMENELSNPELNITRMTEVMKISRTKLYYKIKGLTGFNPNVFFKTYKLNRAAELLLEGRYNVSEIADMTGFSTLSHFSSSFKKQFEVSPSEYLGRVEGKIR